MRSIEFGVTEDTMCTPKAFSLTMILLTLISLLGGPSAQSAEMTSATTLFLEDGQFVFGPNVGDFDLKSYLQANARLSQYVEYADEIVAQADYFSINPMVLFTILYILYPEPSDNFPVEIYETAHELRETFTWHRYNFGPMAAQPALPSGLSVRVGEADVTVHPANSASWAVSALLAAHVTTTVQWQSMTNEFVATYERLFPESRLLDNSNNINPPGPPPSGFLQLPFPRGTSWKFNGPHNVMGGASNYNRPWPSMDFGLEGSCNNPPDMWAVAAAGGYVQRRTTNFGLRIDHGNGWQTAYYHLRDIWERFNPQGGDYVSQNTPLGRISCLYDPGGFADIPHVHFSLLYNGEFVDISRPNPQGDRTRLAGYQVYEGNAPYQGKLVRESEILAYNYVYNDGGTLSWATLNFTVKLKNNTSSNHSSDVAVVVLRSGTNHILFGPNVVRTNADGYYGGLQLSGIQPGRYDICAKAKYYLGQCSRDVYIDAGSVVSIDFSNNGNTPAWPGDIDRYGGDNQVNTLDREMFLIDLRACPGCSGQYRFDFSRNGRLEAEDWSIMAATWKYHPNGEGFFNRPFPLVAQSGERALTNFSGVGSISIQPSFQSAWIGETFGASIVIDTGGNSVSGVDAIVYYDPGILEVIDSDSSKPGIQINSAGLFPNVYINQVDTSQGIIRFMAGYGNDSNQFSGNGTLATLSFRAIAAIPQLAYTTVKPIVKSNTSDDSNESQFNTALDVLDSSELASYIVYGTQYRPSPSISLYPSSGSIIGQNLLSVSAAVSEPYNQIECVAFGLYPNSGNSVYAEDCDGSDGWSAQLDISGIPDQSNITLQASARLRVTPIAYTAESTNITLDRTPPTLDAIFFTPNTPFRGDLVRVDISVRDNFFPYVYTEIWVNTANDSSDHGEWVRVAAESLAPPNPPLPTLWWDTTAFDVGSHLVAVMLRDDVGNWYSWSTVRIIRAPTSNYTYLPLVTRAHNTAIPPLPPSNLHATPVSSTQIRLEWNDNSTNEDGFAIYDGSIFVANAPANATSYVVGGLEPGSYHCFHIYAFNQYGDSAWTDWACTTTPSSSDLDD